MACNFNGVFTGKRMGRSKNRQQHIIDALVAIHYPSMNGLVACAVLQVFAEYLLSNRYRIRPGKPH